MKVYGETVKRGLLLIAFPTTEKKRIYQSISSKIRIKKIKINSKNLNSRRENPSRVEDEESSGDSKRYLDAIKFKLGF